VRSRGDDGRILDWDWHPVGIEEYGYAAPDPLDPNIVYGGKVTRYDRRTGQIQQVGPSAGGRGGGGPNFRTLRTAPLVFSMADPHTLLYGTNVVWKTINGGKSWTQISPDLTRTDSIVPASVGTYSTTSAAKARHAGVIYALGPSYIDAKRIWAGTDDGLIQTTADGGAHWTDVTPADLRPKAWSKISIIDAGHFDTQTAYAAVNTLRIDDFTPHIYRTHDGGKTWKEIVSGIDSGAVINVVREDPKRKGLLFAGSEDQVWVSFDDGDHWSSLRINMPATSIRDLVIKDDDIAIGTHGRSFYILDDISALRQINGSTAASTATLFKPAQAWRFRFSKYPDTPIPPDEPWAKNPPDGAIIDYYLGANTSGDAKLEIVEQSGRVIRSYSSRDTSMAPEDVGNTPKYWIRPTQVLSAASGFHRFVWDLHYAPPAGTSSQPGNYPISATPHDTPREPRGPWALPGTYTARLTVGGKTYSQTFAVKMDPRVKTLPTALAAEHVMAVALFDDVARDSAIAAQTQSIRRQLGAVRGDASVTEAVSAFTTKLGAIAGAGGGGGRRGGGGGRGRGAAPTGPTFASINGELMSLMALLEDADVEPTITATNAVHEAQRDFDGLVARWKALTTTELAALNVKLKAAGQATVSVTP
jgi:photosystem II stability/assembly factor-like uncharacterized protein